MFCSKCGNVTDEGVSFCRLCGNELENSSLKPVTQHLPREKNVDRGLIEAKSKDPDELTGNGIGSVIVGDGFFMVAIILSVTDSAVSSLLWLFLLIPAFYCFGKGLADVVHARQIRRRQKQNENALTEAAKVSALPPASVSVLDIFKKSISGELTAVPSVTERTTRDLN